MNRVLRYGSTGDDVAKLQQGLNLLPSTLEKLQPDGHYGPKTTSRVKEFQGANGLVPDGITGPLTWELFLRLLQQVQAGGIPVVPELPKSAADALRPLVLAIAQQHIGRVDFSVMIGGKPKGLDFLIEMFRVAANVTLTEANFRKNGTGNWHWKPWIGLPSQEKSWCGIFVVYCYRKAGLDASWNIGAGKPAGRVKLSSWSPQFATSICAADMGCVATQSHHFLIESVDGTGPAPTLTTIDGNQTWGRIERKSSFHKVGKDNFNYYQLN